jgi:hypothetical protein
MAGKSPIAPILIADKTTIAFSAEEGGRSGVSILVGMRPRSCSTGNTLRSGAGPSKGLEFASWRARAGISQIGKAVRGG